MKVKVIIFCNDRNNVGMILNKKNRKANQFTFRENNYSIASEHFVITKGWAHGWRWNYITFYYKEDCPNPLPAPHFPDIKNNGITTGELNALFNPIFYRIIAQSQNQKKLEYMMYGIVAVGVIAAYGDWLLMQLPDKIIKLLGSPVIPGK